MAPQTTKQWTVEGKEGFDSLKFNKSASLPEVGSEEVLVKFHAASLNYRDLLIPRVRERSPNVEDMIHRLIHTFRGNTAFRTS